MSRCQVCGDPEHYEDWHSPERVAARLAEEQERAEEEATALAERIRDLEARVAVIEQKLEAK